MYAKLCYGQAGSIIMKLLIMGESFGCCAAHLKVFGETVQSILVLFFNFKNIVLSNEKFYVFAVFIVILPFVFKENISALKNTSFVGDLSVLIFIASVFVLFIYKLFTKSITSITINLFFRKFSFVNLFNCSTALLEAYYFQAVIFAVYLSLENRKNKTMKKITRQSVLFCTLIYIFTGLLVLLMYGEDTSLSLIKMFRDDLIQHQEKSIYITMLLLCILTSLLISSLFTFPLTFFALKTNFLNLCVIIKKKILFKYQNKTQEGTELTESNEEVAKKEFTAKTETIELTKCGKYTIIFFLYSFVLAVALFADELLTICNFVGSTCSNFVTMLAPTAFLIILSKTNIINSKMLWEKMIFILGILILITFFILEALKFI